MQPLPIKMVAMFKLAVLTTHFIIGAEPGMVDKILDSIVVCYVSTWAVYRPGNGMFDISHINPELCSHLIYAFAGINATDYTIKPLDPWNDLEDGGGRGGYRKITKLRDANKKLKVSLSIGGWNEGSANYSAMASTNDRRKTFVNSVVKMVRDFQFDGFDFFWEYPTKRGGHPEDKQNLVSLVKELRQAFDTEERATGHHLLLTSVVGESPDVIRSAYDLQALNQYLDYFHLMSYDYHGHWEPVAGVNAPLRGRSDEDQLSLEKSLELLLTSGAKKEKILLGIPLYGRTFTASNAESPKLGSATQKEGFSGPFTEEAGFMGYNEICEELQQNATQWKISWDERSATHYAVRDRLFISFDDPLSIDAKIQFAMKKGIAGTMVWSLDTDDFRGICAKTTGYSNYPLLRTINKSLAKSLVERQNKIAKDRKDKQKANKSSRMAVPIFSLLTSLYAVLLIF